MVFGLFMVWYNFFDFWDKDRPVIVTVKTMEHQKTGPDQTRLSNSIFKYNDSNIYFSL